MTTLKGSFYNDCVGICRSVSLVDLHTFVAFKAFSNLQFTVSMDKLRHVIGFAEQDEAGFE